MSIRLYMDVHVPLAITQGLRLRGVDVLTAQEDDARQFDDPRLLDRSSSLGRILCSRDADLLAEATRRQREGIAFAGVIFAHQLQVTIGACVRDLELISVAGEPEDLAGRVYFLPLQ